MTAKDLVESAEADGIEFGSLGERCVYLLFRYHGDRKGIVRISLTEMAARLGVSRRTITDHVEALVVKRLMSRQGHGRYRIHAAPWSLRDVARAYRETLQEGDEWDGFTFAEMAFGERFSADSSDPRLDEALAYSQSLERAGLLVHDEITGLTTVARKKPA